MRDVLTFIGFVIMGGIVGSVLGTLLGMGIGTACQIIGSGGF
jgi:hypothetical protein